MGACSFSSISRFGVGRFANFFVLELGLGMLGINSSKMMTMTTMRLN